VFCKSASFQEPSYLFGRPEDKALLESNPSTAPGDDGGAGLLRSALLFLPLQILLQEQELWGVSPGKEIQKTLFDRHGQASGIVSAKFKKFTRTV
jgi:hypothetical protein